MSWLFAALVVCLVLYGLFLVALLLAGRRLEARAWAGFIPHCLILFRRLLGDQRVPRRRKVALGLLLAYLAMPLDLVPDFVPLIGQLDDAVLVALVLRYVLRTGGPAVVRELWPGPRLTLEVVLRLGYGRGTAAI
jgi:uncharacterized membrane protein YkvA (DUF1232 family)